MTPRTGNFVAYYRVSTRRQAASGLGLEAQKKMVEEWLDGGNWNLVGEFTETESGKRTIDRRRPELRSALECCKTHNATLIVAKLDRLFRNVSFLSRLLDSGVEIVALRPQLVQQLVELRAVRWRTGRAGEGCGREKLDGNRCAPACSGRWPRRTTRRGEGSL